MYFYVIRSFAFERIIFDRNHTLEIVKVALQLSF